MIGWLRTRVRKQPIIALYFEFETVLKFDNLEAWYKMRFPSQQRFISAGQNKLSPMNFFQSHNDKFPKV